MLERDKPKPLYMQLREILVEKIESEEWAVNSKIPSENELSSIYGLSRMTVRSVLTDLVREGMLYRVQGKGTFVAEKITTVSPYYTGIREQLEKMGYEVTTKVIEHGIIPCPESIVNKMKLKSGDSIYRIRRVRYIKGEPLSIHTSHIPVQYCKNLDKQDLEGEQLCVILSNQYDLKRKKVEEILESAMANEDEAELLSIEKGYPLLMLRDTLYNEKDIPYEYTKIVFRGDKIKIKLEFDE